MKTSLSLFSLLLLGALGAHAQPAPREIPNGPLLANAPDPSEWVVTFTYPEDKDKAATGTAPVPQSPPPAYLNERPRTITTTKVSNVIHEQIVDLKGKVSDKWYVGGIQYRKTAGSALWYQDEAGLGANFNFTPLPASGFRSLDWITRDAYVNTTKYLDHSCFVFAPGAAADPAKLASLQTVAFIDAGTRLPVEVRTGGIIRSFQFTTPSSDAGTLPPDLAAQIKKGEQGRARLAQPAPRPY